MAAAFADDAVWAAEDWRWDPHKMQATPAEPGAGSKSSGGKSARGSAAPDTGKLGCQVDGCTFEVGSQKDYHSRYKICEFHLKAHVVQKDGRAHRFCQQCGKFQLLGDFDGDKRSCRARLEKHNARRRRQREMAHMLKKTGTIDEKVLIEKYGMSEEQLAPKMARISKAGYSLKAKGSLADKSGSPAPPSATGGTATATAGRSPSATAATSPSSAQRSSMMDAGDASTGQPSSMVAGTAAAAQAAAQMEAETHAQTAALLGQLQAQQQAREAQMGAALAAQAQAAAAAQAQVQAAAAYQQAALAQAAGKGQSLGLGSLGASDLGLLLDDSFLDEARPGLQVFNPMLDAGLAPSAAAGAAAQYLSVDAGTAMDMDDVAALDQLTTELLAGRAGTAGLGGGPHQMLGGCAATWPAAYPGSTASLTSAVDTPSASDSLAGTTLVPPYLTAPGLHAPGAAPPPFAAPLLGASPFSGGLQPPPPLPGAMRLPGAGLRVESPPSGRSTVTALHPGSQMLDGPGSVLDEALHLLSYDTAQITYVPEERLVRFSAKLFNCTPAQLPSDLKASLVNMLSCQSMEGYLRPGCVHITVNALVGPEERALLASAGVRAVVERLVARQPEAFWSQHAMLVQLGDKLALVREGRVVHVLATADSSLFPRVAAVRPLVAEPDAGGAATVSVWGYNLGQEEDTLLARSNGAYVEVERLGLEADPAWRGMQRLDLRLTGVTSPGAVQLEVMRGGYISASKALLVTGDRLLAAEVRSLEAEESSTDVDTLLFQLAACQQYAAGGGGRTYAAEDLSVLGKSSRRLLAYTVQRKWVAATRTLLMAVAADQPAAEAVAAVDVMCVGTTGMPLLQLAVRSQRLELVRAALDWGEAHGFVFRSTTPGRRGLTALHLAGLVSDGGAIAALLSERCADAVGGWEGARAEDGTLPIDFARRTGLGGQVERFIATRKYQAAVARGSAKASGPEPGADDKPGDGLAGAPSTLKDSVSDVGPGGSADGAKACGLRQRKAAPTCDSASSSRTPSKTLPSEDGSEGEDQVAAVKAALKARLAEERVQGGLLRFRTPALEQRYQAWYSAGQLPVDIAFLLIATLSQGAWIFRWSLDASWLGVAMVALMSMNALMMQLAVLFPSAYVKWREPLCVWSHVAHKLAQAAVTLVPPVGTIFSTSYNPTVALLESSSLAQVHMLSFGMRLRFGTHLAVDLFHFAAAVAANDQICAAGFPFIPGGACNALMFIWQALACFALPCALVYASERRSRRIFLETSGQAA